MPEPDINQIQGLTPEGIKKLELLKKELEAISHAMQNMDRSNKHEVEDRIRAFQDKEAEAMRFLQELGVMPKK